MTIHSRLDDLRTRYSGCTVAAFADLSTGMVLASSTMRPTGQETLDALCRVALRLFAPGMPDGLKGADASDAGGAPWYAITGFRGSLACFVKSPVLAEEAICLVGEDPAEIMELAVAARELLCETGVDA